MKSFAQQVADLEPEAVARKSAVCPCCGGDKPHNSLVCMRCYKAETPGGFAPLKFAGIPFEQWLTSARKKSP